MNRNMNTVKSIIPIIMIAANMSGLIVKVNGLGSSTLYRLVWLCVLLLIPRLIRSIWIICMIMLFFPHDLC